MNFKYIKLYFLNLIGPARVDSETQDLEPNPR